MRLPAPPILVRLLLALAVLAGPSEIRAQSDSAAGAAPPPKVLYLIRGPDGIVTAIRAVSAQQQGTVLLIVNANGGRAMVQARSIVGQLPWFTDEEIEGGAVEPIPLAAKYEAFASRLPVSQRKFLNDEAARFRAVQKRRDDEIAARKNAAEARVQSVTTATYEPASGYTIEGIEALLQAADAVRTEDPSATARIDQWAAPFREHLANLQAGSRYENGAWITREDLARRERAAREAAFLKSLDAPAVSALALPAATPRGIAAKAAAGAGLAILAGSGLLIAFRRRPLVRVAGITLLVGGPVSVAVLFFLATRDPGPLPAATAPADLQPIIALLAGVAGIEGEPSTPTSVVTEAAVNTFLARHVRIAPPAGAEKWTALREALAVRFLPGRVLVFELLRCAGRSWIVRYDVVVPKGGATGPLVVSRVRLGALDCPDGIAGELWNSLAPQLARVFADLSLSGRLAIKDVRDGAMELVPLAPPKNSPIQPSAPGRTEAPAP